MTQLEQLCAEHGVTLDAVDCGVHTDDSNWQHREWRVTLKLQGRTFTSTYRTGIGHDRKVSYSAKTVGVKPKPADVLYCLCSDSRAGEMHFHDFCSEFGYDEDSRKAETIWRACVDTYRTLPKFLGPLYETFCNAEH